MSSVNNLDCWAIVELMGHVRIAGRVTEEERFGAKMGRIDIPKNDPCECVTEITALGGNAKEDCTKCGGWGTIEGFTTQYFGGGSIYRLTPCSEAAARLAAKSSTHEPIKPWELPRQLTAQAARNSPLEDDDDDDDDR